MGILIGIVVGIIAFIILICIIYKVVSSVQKKNKLITLDTDLSNKYENLRLSIEFIPKKNRRVNLHEIIEYKNEWNTIKQGVRRFSQRISTHENRGKCYCCGKEYSINLIECHEVWEWDIKTRSQRLVKVIPLCPFCHNVKHFGRNDEGLRRLANSWLKYVNHFHSDEESERYRHYIFKIKRPLYDKYFYTLDKSSINHVVLWAKAQLNK